MVLQRDTEPCDRFLSNLQSVYDVYLALFAALGHGSLLADLDLYTVCVLIDPYAEQLLELGCNSRDLFID